MYANIKSHRLIIRISANIISFKIKSLQKIMQMENYCEHFRTLKLTKTIMIDQSMACTICLQGKQNLWMCLSKNCGKCFCDRNEQEHMVLHLEQSRKKKSFHSIFINVLTAKIVCVHCKIEIFDLEHVKVKSDQLQNPYPLRLKVLPYLADLENTKNWHLENPEGHRKINSSFIGLFGDKHNHTINSAIQFLMQFSYFKDLIFQLKVSHEALILKELQLIYLRAKEAQFRAIKTDELTKIIYEKNPKLLGYSRKDPFDHVITLMKLVNQELKYYQLDSMEWDKDEWEFLGRPSLASNVLLKCPLYDSMSCGLSLNYRCSECHFDDSSIAEINFIKLNFPKKKRKARQIEKQLADHRCESPIKRRNSLMNLIMPEQQCPFTIQELLIDLMKQPLHKEKQCPNCQKKMSNKKIHFSSLSDYIIILINRMKKDGNSIDDTPLKLDFNPLDMGPFTQHKESVKLYDLEAAICIENKFHFPVLAKNQFNKQTYLFKNEIVSIMQRGEKLPNPYVLCYKRRPSNEENQKKISALHLINKKIDNQEEKMFTLPDFWFCQLKHNIHKPLYHQLVCRHSRLKPYVNSKMLKEKQVSIKTYEYLVDQFGGTNLYKDIQCQKCIQELKKLQQRKSFEKQKIIELDNEKIKCFCMVSNEWIKKWTTFLYKKGQFAYFSKGFPFPGPIDNKVLLNGTKCRVDLKKNVDYIIVNVFVWKFLVELYGGGPEIRYKWNKAEMNKLEEDKILEIKRIGKDLKEPFLITFPESPKKTVVIERTSSYIQSARDCQFTEELSEDL